MSLSRKEGKIPPEDLVEVVFTARQELQGLNLRHKKTNGYYIVEDVVFLEADMSIHAVYHSLTYPSLKFCRPISEIRDGRFELLGHKPRG